MSQEFTDGQSFVQAAPPVDSASPGPSLRLLTVKRAALPMEFHSQTTVLRRPTETRLELGLKRIGFIATSRRILELRGAWQLFRQAAQYDAVITTGTLEGLAYAAFERLGRRQRPVHVMYDCLWYGGDVLRRAWLRFCVQKVDRCIVWAKVERRRYAEAYGVAEDKFLFVPHHHTLKDFAGEVRDDGFVFAGGNQDRDWGLFLQAVRGTGIPCVLATNRVHNLAQFEIPPNVRVVNATPAEFRELMAASRCLVLPMQSTFLHAGGQQTILNAQMMGKAVILTDPEGGADYIEDGKTGFLIRYGDPARLREAIRHLWEHPERARAMGQRAREIAAPLTTEHTNTLIWHHAEEMARARRATHDLTK